MPAASAYWHNITWQQINLRIDSGGLGVGIDARTSYAAFAASFLSAVKAASEIYPILHGDIRVYAQRFFDTF